MTKRPSCRRGHSCGRCNVQGKLISVQHLPSSSRFRQVLCLDRAFLCRKVTVCCGSSQSRPSDLPNTSALSLHSWYEYRMLHMVRQPRLILSCASLGTKPGRPTMCSTLHDLALVKSITQTCLSPGWKVKQYQQFSEARDTVQY